MAVQAQYPSNVLLLNRNVQEGKNLLGNSNDYSLQPQPGEGGGFVDQSHIMLLNNNNNNGVHGGGVNPRKRSREVAPTTTPVANTNNNMMNSFSFSLQNREQQQQQNPNQSHQLIDISQLQNHSQYQQQQPNVVSTGLRLSFGDQNQQHHFQQQQIQQQTSLLSLVSEELALQLKQQNDELNYFLHAQREQLRRTLAEKRQRHYRALIGAAEEAVARRVREKEGEVEKAARRNAELEARAAQLSAEAQAWQAKARAQETQAASLQAQIHQAMLAPSPVEDREGVTGSGGAQAEDSESAYVDPVVSERRVLRPSCKLCRTRNASIVLLPCRHLCVCAKCDNGVVSACPVCLSIRSASVEVFLS